MKSKCFSACRIRGFTLLELMIAVVVAAVLATIAVPSYQSSVKKSRRADAKSALLGLANAMERHFTVNNTYLDAGTTDTNGNGTGDTGAPTIFPATTPADASTANYNLTITTANATTYTLRAAPVGVQAGDGNLELGQDGSRRWDKNNDGDFTDTGEDSWD
jgi:type IV pilus assembly protein PilE